MTSNIARYVGEACIVVANSMDFPVQTYRKTVVPQVVTDEIRTKGHMNGHVTPVRPRLRQPIVRVRLKSLRIEPANADAVKQVIQYTCIQ
jgi:hypothetical protein